MATFLLVAGAWHAGWCWEYVAPLLTARGHAVIAADLPGTGHNDAPLESVTRAGWARFVGELIRDLPERVILVGHSRGGLTIGDAAGLVADRIVCMVYLSAMVTAPGIPLAQVAAMMMAHEGEAIRIELTPDGTSFSLAAEQIEPLFYNCTPPDLVARAATALRPEPAGGSAGEMVPSDAVLAIPKIYIECLQDRAVPIAVQRRLQTLTRFDRVLQIDADHSPFYSAPEDLAACLDEIATSYEAGSSEPRLTRESSKCAMI